MQLPGLLRIAKLTGLVAALAMMLCAIWAGWNQIDVLIAFRRPGPLMVGCALYTLYCVLNANAWLLILKSLGYSVPAFIGIPLWIRCESLRWLPGNIWNFGARSVEANQHGVPGSTGAISMTTELGFSVLSRVMLAGCGGLLFVGQFPADSPPILPANVLIGAGCMALLLAAIFFAVRHKREAIQAHGNNLVKLAKSVCDRTRSGESTALLLYYLGIGYLHGLALECLIVSMTGRHDVPLLAIISANAAAWLVGFFAIFAPGGLVVREAALATALAPWFSPTESLSIAICWRLVQTIVEFLLLACVLWSDRKRPHTDRADLGQTWLHWIRCVHRGGAS